MHGANSSYVITNNLVQINNVKTGLEQHIEPRPVLLFIQSVMLRGKIRTSLLYDSGSNTSLITRALAKLLNLPFKTVGCWVTVATKEAEFIETRVYEMVLPVVSHGKEWHKKIYLYEVPGQITSDPQPINVKAAYQLFPGVPQGALDRPTDPVGILLGMDCADLMPTRSDDNIGGRQGNLICMKTVIGGQGFVLGGSHALIDGTDTDWDPTINAYKQAKIINSVKTVVVNTLDVTVGSAAPRSNNLPRHTGTAHLYSSGQLPTTAAAAPLPYRSADKLRGDSQPSHISTPGKTSCLPEYQRNDFVADNHLTFRQTFYVNPKQRLPVPRDEDFLPRQDDPPGEGAEAPGQLLQQGSSRHAARLRDNQSLQNPSQVDLHSEACRDGQLPTEEEEAGARRSQIYKLLCDHDEASRQGEEQGLQEAPERLYNPTQETLPIYPPPTEVGQRQEDQDVARGDAGVLGPDPKAARQGLHAASVGLEHSKIPDLTTEGSSSNLIPFVTISRFATMDNTSASSNVITTTYAYENDGKEYVFLYKDHPFTVLVTNVLPNVTWSIIDHD
ncbi:MAG: hypothetical protein GY737_18915, partial [Desulfobacteraceae bacterium]|nr:hypothetical protein [Desulfobacteraceae bacterium]